MKNEKALAIRSACGLENRFCAPFTGFVFRTHDQDRALLCDLANAVEADMRDNLIRGRFVKMIPHPYLTEVFYGREHSWLQVAEGFTDQDEQATVVLQFFTFPAYVLKIFMSDFCEFLNLRERFPPLSELDGIAQDPDRPVIVISALSEAENFDTPSSSWHQILNLNEKGAHLGVIHQLTCCRMGNLPEEMHGNRLQLWMDFFCRRDRERFETAALGDPVFEKLLSLEQRFMHNPKLMAEYRDTEETMQPVFEEIREKVRKFRARQSGRQRVFTA